MKDPCKVIETIKSGLKSFGLPILEEEKTGPFTIIDSEIKYAEHTKYVRIIFDSKNQTIVFAVNFSHGVSSERRQTIIELINLIHMVLDTGHFAVCPNSGVIGYRDSMFIQENQLDGEMFKAFLNKSLADCSQFLPIIHEQIFRESPPEEIMVEYCGNDLPFLSDKFKPVAH